MIQGRRVGVVIPARNEELHIEGVLIHLPETVDLAVVVNDGSVDRTAEAARLAKAPCEGGGDRRQRRRRRCRH